VNGVVEKQRGLQGARRARPDSDAESPVEGDLPGVSLGDDQAGL